jgi:hypothetical protein
MRLPLALLGIFGTVSSLTLVMGASPAAAAPPAWSASSVQAGNDTAAFVNQVVCTGTGTCTAVGNYQDSNGNGQGMVVQESSGTWGTAQQVSLPANAGPTPSAVLASVSCTATGTCEAVGTYQDTNGDTQMLTVAESSGTWQTGVEVTPPANALSDPNAVLGSVSCSSAGNCTAVGTYVDNSSDTQGVLATESSGAWTSVEVTLPTGAGANPNVALAQVSCSSAGNCTAVGYYEDGSGQFQGLLLTETSGTWTATEAQLPSGASADPNVTLDGVACTSAGNCTAVGDYTDSSSHVQGVFLTQSSGSWTAAEATPPASATNPEVVLSSVSCPSAGACTAVGGFDNSSGHFEALAFNETLSIWGTGTALSPPAGAATNPNAFLASVSCSSAANCSAVGEYYDSGQVQQGLLASETAGTWGSGEEVTAPAGASSNRVEYMGSVSCTGTGNCSASGIYLDSNQVFEGLVITQSSGTWGSGEKVTLPAGAGSVPNLYLYSDSCPTATDCVAVGVVSNAEDTLGAVATESGGSWSVSEPTMPSGAVPPYMVLNSVSCPSAGNCSAVGTYLDSLGTQQGLLLDDSSGTWQAGVTAALPAGAGSNPMVQLTSVSCASAGNCTAVGWYQDTSQDTQGLLLTETSGTWATGVKAPLPAGADSNPLVSLQSVSCTAAGTCAAVGTYSAGGNSEGLLLSQSGGTWSVGVEATLPSGAAADPQVTLNAVSCAGTGDCTAVGSYADTSGSFLPLIVAEGSGTWGTGMAPGLPTGAATRAGGQFAGLTSVSCAQPGDCGAVGYYVDSSGYLQAVMVSEFTGTWRIGAEATLPNGAATDPTAFLDSVSCTDAGDCAAVGLYTDTLGNQQAFEETEMAGSWNTATQAAVPAGAASPSQAILNSVSCASDGNCTAVGSYPVGTAGADGLIETLTTPLPAPTPLPYNPVTPTRICDTRAASDIVQPNQCNGDGTTTGTMTPGGQMTITMPGVVPAGATAVVLNVTVTNTTAASFLTVWPTGSPLPNASNLNWVAGDTVPNLVEVSLGPGNKVSFYNPFGDVDVVVDLEGYVASTSAGTGLFNPLAPARICDTRAESDIVPANQCNGGGTGTGTLGPDGQMTIDVTNLGGVPPSGVGAVVLNVTVTNTTAPSFLTVWPAGGTEPNASNVNWVAGQTVPNRVIVPLGTGVNSGKVTIANTFGSTDVVVDVGGWFTDNSNASATGAQYVALTPVRICDTRPEGSIIPANQCNEEGNATGTLGPSGKAVVQVGGLGGVPANAVAVVANTTVADTTAPSFLTVYPDGTTLPNASDLNWVGGEVVPNLVVVELGPNGAVDATNTFGSTDLIMDVEGYYTG